MFDISLKTHTISQEITADPNQLCNIVCKLCFIQMRDLRQIRQYLTHDAALTAANTLVGSRLDYCNSLFRSLSVANLRKLQCIQKSLARIVCRTTCLSHTTPLRKALHWLPIRHRCIFKTALLVYKYLHTNCPKYFSPFLNVPIILG